jgi:hypothetical protein
MVPRFYHHADKEHIALVIAERRRLCVGEGFAVVSPARKPVVRRGVAG